MSDFSEVRHGHKILLNIVWKPANRTAFYSALDGCAPGAAEEALTLFDTWWVDISLNTYIYIDFEV
jgi:hypothetical protein